MPVSNAFFMRATIASLVVGFAAVAAIVVGALWEANRTERFSTELADVLEIRREAFRLIILTLDAETGQRGFLLTSDESYLEPYERALRDIETELVQLKAVTASRQNYTEPVARLEALVAAKFAELARTIDLARAGKTMEAFDVVRGGSGKAAMEGVREVSSELAALSTTDVAESTNTLLRAARMLVWLLAGGGMVILTVVAGSAFLAIRYTGELQRAQREVGALNMTLEARVRERSGDLQRANEEIQRFAYIVSHDLRSPLVNVMGFTSELEANLAAIRAQADAAPIVADDPTARAARAAIDEEIPEAIGFIRAATTKMDRLISAILSLSREGRRTMTAERVDMGPLLDGISGSVQHQLSAAGTVLEIARPMPVLQTDRLAVEQIFGNLIDNAMKYMEPGRSGRIEVTARETPMGIDFQVRDNGRGIAAEDHDRIFDLFRRAGRQDVAGEGIGLSHVQALVRRLGGTISLDSALGQGTTFRIRLPQTLPTSRET